MSDNQRTCSLIPLDDSFDTVPLPHNELTVVGRGPVTNIADKRLSRKQVEFTADCNLMEVKCKIVGPNAAVVNGFKAEQNFNFTAFHGFLIELLCGKYKYKIEFSPPPPPDKQNKACINESLLTDGMCSPPRKKQHCEVPKEKKHEPTKESTWEKIDNGKVPKEERREPTKESTWETIDNGKMLIYSAQGVEGRSKIAGYDIDGTVILTKSGRVFPVDHNDWKLAFNEVATKLKSLWNKNYKIVFFTNQAGIAKGKVKVSDFKNKVKEIISRINVPIQVFVSTGEGIYRKPAPGMWTSLVEKKNDGVEVDMSQSFYCGDAAGREVNWAPKKKKDFSCSDRLFALNLGLKFYTPEEHFLGMPPARFKLPDFNPSSLNFNGHICDPPHASITSDKQEVVIMVGFQGSGKSFFTSNYLVPEGYIPVNRDQLGSWQKCVSVMESALNMGKSVVIDNTNPDKESRKRFIDVASSRNISCRCFLLTTSIQHAKHNNKFRELTDKSHEPITDAIINMYKNKFEEPSLLEGFSAVLKINCVPKINDPDMRKLYKMYLMDK